MELFSYSLSQSAHCYCTESPKHTMEKRQTLQQMLLRKLVIFLQKTETQSMPVTLYSYQIKVY
jgi:hypothetical protein